jgi:hypothetical protein
VGGIDFAMCACGLTDYVIWEPLIEWMWDDQCTYSLQADGQEQDGDESFGIYQIIDGEGNVVKHT